MRRSPRRPDAHERTKLTAGWLNTLATAFRAAGTFAPIAALLYGLSTPATGAAYVSVLMLVCFALAVSLHFGGRIVLGRLRE